METNFWRITIDTNPEDCNLNCIMCEEHSHLSDFKEKLFKNTGIAKRRMPFSWLEKIISEAKELGVKEIIPTTMGDPLVTAHFEKIVSLAKKNNIKLNVTHNGTFPGKTIKAWAGIIIPVTNDIKISWNGATPETAENIMRGLDFKKAKENIVQFIQYRDEINKGTGHYCKVSFQLTFLRNNMHEIEEIIKLASSIGVDRIKGHHVWPHFNELKELSFTTNPKTKSEWNKWVELAKKKALEIKRNDNNEVILENFELLTYEINLIVPEAFICPFLGKELWISAMGNISPCCAPDKLRQSLGDFGNINNTTLKKVIESDQYLKLLRTYKTHELCKKCNMRKSVII